MQLVTVTFPLLAQNGFDYVCHASDIQIGCRVIAPLGNQQKVGIVTHLLQESTYDLDKLKSIIQVVDSEPLFCDELYQLLLWAARYYHAPLGEVLFQALPVLLRKGKTNQLELNVVWRVQSSALQRLDAGELNRAKKQKQALLALMDNDPQHQSYPRSIYLALQKKGFINEVAIEQEVQLWTDQLRSNWVNINNKHRLNQQQALIVNKLCFNQGFNCYLLDGITGSGKTEVYLQFMESVLTRGLQVLLLVPEIGLTPQLVKNITYRFNIPIAVLHSNISDAQRLLIWQKTKLGEYAIVIGTRSALFTQFYSLGAIIIDEEHDLSYKQQETRWRYHLRDLAIVRAKNLNIPILLGSATPSFESLANVEMGKYHYLQLTNKAVNNNQLTHQIIDLRGQNLSDGLSHTLLDLMRIHLEQGNQVLLFLNRRGFAPVLLCHECGWIAECQSCDKPFTYHQKKQVLHCHHCDTKKKLPNQCQHCGSTHLTTIGVGTEQLEKVLKDKFPNYGVVRIDRDSVKNKHALNRHLGDVLDKKSRILIGTQMLAKGHHFPDVTLVALINVDSALFSQDFRSEERLAQQYIQVAGRAGRGIKSGHVVLQTHFPEHPSLQKILNEGYASFAQQGLAQRKLMNFPPYTYQALFRVKHKKSEQAEKYLQQIAEFLELYLQQKNIHGLSLFGPIEAQQAKRANFYHRQLLIQHHQRHVLQQCLDYFDDNFNDKNGLKYVIDVDPMDW